MDITSTRRWLLCLVAVVFVVRCVHEYDVAFDVWKNVRGRPYEAYFQVVPGLVSIVEWVRSNAGPERVYGPDPLQQPYLGQRLVEMLYPLEVHPYPQGEKVRSGSLVIVPIGLPVEKAHESLFLSGDLQIVRIME